MNKDLGNIIKNRRLELRLYMKDVAKACDVTEATVSRWEHGETQNIKRGTLMLLSNILYLPVDVLLGIEPIENVNISAELIVKRNQLITLINKIDDIETLDKIGQILGVLVPMNKQ